MRAAIVATALLLFAISASASHPLRIEDFHFFPESGWNRDDAALQYNTLLFGATFAHEINQEWSKNGRHQLGFTVPLYTDRITGFGDATLNYRYQLLGNDGSRFGVAPRLSLVLPTRSRSYGERSDGLQVSVPLSIALSSRVESHTNLALTWFRTRHERELSAGQGFAFQATERASLAVDAQYTRASGGAHVVVVRPSFQYAFDAPGGITIAPGIAAPLGDGIMFFVAIEHPLGK